MLWRHLRPAVGKKVEPKRGVKEGKKCTRLRELRESAEDGGQVFLESSGQRPKETARSGKSIYLHDTRRGVQDQVMEGEQGRVLQGALSRASFRQSPVSGQKHFTVLSLLVSNNYAKKKGIAKKLILTLRAILNSQEVDLVAGDFNGTAWRYRSKDNFSTIDEAHGGIARRSSRPFVLL